jgi:EAL domain-containing protein (putative c-di-GMP-specific phosphodiesterase class I)
MPLQELVNYFNQRLVAEQSLKTAPLTYANRQVEGRFAGLHLASAFHPIRRAINPDIIVGYDAVLKTTPTDGQKTLAEQAFLTATSSGVVNLDRLCRTIHMLNYLPISHEHGYLFLHVHPRHILGVKRDHGAYFENIIFRCGLSPSRAVITLLVTPVYDRQFSLLMEGLKNYQQRGYRVAIKFDNRVYGSFIERYCIAFLQRFSPDFVRVNGAFFANLQRDEDHYFKTSSLLSAIHRLDASFLVDEIDSADDARQAKGLRADLVVGQYYERELATELAG